MLLMSLTLEIGKPVNCDVVVNRHIDLTEEEKAEQKALALKRYQEGGAAQVASAPLQAKDKQAARDETTPTLTF